MRGLVALFVALIPLPAHAYIGPGLGVGVISAIFGIILAVGLAIFAVIWYPIKRMIKKKKTAKSESESS